MNCVFCDIIQKKIETEFVYEDENIIAFSDIRPKAPVHMLIAPKKHIESIKNIDGNNEILAGKMINAARIIAENKSLSGYKLIFNVGKKGGQIIDHLHLHLLGGWNEKNIKDINI